MSEHDSVLRLGADPTYIFLMYIQFYKYEMYCIHKIVAVTHGSHMHVFTDIQNISALMDELMSKFYYY